MNPGSIQEEAGQTARGLIDALKAQPAVLALSLAQIAMLLFIFYALSKAAEFRDTMINKQHDYAVEVTKLLSKCVVPDKSTWTTEPLKPIGEVEEPHKEP